MSDSFTSEGYVTVSQLRYSCDVVDTIYIFTYLDVRHRSVTDKMLACWTYFHNS